MPLLHIPAPVATFQLQVNIIHILLLGSLFLFPLNWSQPRVPHYTCVQTLHAEQNVNVRHD
ncbi:hypothetical protein EXN66_Car016209 [Channa argus]|uniref:Uncharacterized protein n=1 Tax=Channa argus TaxID=215402 RepID=A0A6G1QD92_CHAAH|nr:hypothetical protein EXN66_Car016209 [Channa argus]